MPAHRIQLEGTPGYVAEIALIGTRGDVIDFLSVVDSDTWSADSDDVDLTTEWGLAAALAQLVERAYEHRRSIVVRLLKPGPIVVLSPGQPARFRVEQSR